MKNVKYLLSLLALLSTMGFAQPNLDKEINVIHQQASNLDLSVLRLSLNAYQKAKRQGMHIKPYLTIIDYSKPSTERRLWVVDLNQDKVLYNTWVAHGKNSGNIRATSFSNAPGSLKSSLGVFLTEEPYIGGKGYSLRLRGLEHGINDNAYYRKVVMHGAWYVSSSTAKRNGHLGRSWGCPAVDPHIVHPLIDTIKENSLVVAYYPDQHWLRNSTFLTG